MTSLATFRFPKIFRRFSKILQTLSECRVNVFVPRNLRRLPKISEEQGGFQKTSEKVPKTFRSHIQFIIDIIIVKIIVIIMTQFM